MFTFSDRLGPDILVMEVTGKITHADYRDGLIPKAEALMAKGPLKALCVVDSDVTDFTLEAMWDDQKFGLEHWRDLSHLALVTDHAWMRAAAALAAPFYPAEIRAYGKPELADAEAWIKAA